MSWLKHSEAKFNAEEKKMLEVRYSIRNRLQVIAGIADNAAAQIQPARIQERFADIYSEIMKLSEELKIFGI